MKSKKVTIEVEFNLYTVKIHGRLIHNLTISQATAIAELYLQYNDFPSVIVIYEQNFNIEGELMFEEHCKVVKIVQLDKQYVSGTSFTLSDIQSLI